MDYDALRRGHLAAGVGLGQRVILPEHAVVAHAVVAVEDAQVVGLVTEEDGLEQADPALEGVRLGSGGHGIDSPNGWLA